MWKLVKKYPFGALGLFVVLVFVIIGVYAPFFASSKPLIIEYDGHFFFPLFRYLFFGGYYTKPIDLFFNLLMFTLPLMLIGFRSIRWVTTVIFLQIALFFLLLIYGIHDPASKPEFEQQKLARDMGEMNWGKELETMNTYSRLNAVVNYQINKQHHQTLESYLPGYDKEIESRWGLDRAQIKAKKGEQQGLSFLEERDLWLDKESKKINFMVMPFFRSFHWEEDAGGDQALNQKLPWWELTRINRKDLVSALIFGIRISLVVGFLAVTLALLIGVPVGALAGYYGGVFDIVVSRLLEIWESMPTFFMLLLVVAFLQSKSIFLVIAVIGFFGWTTFSRYIRGEFFKQRNLPYIEATRAIGLPDRTIIFRHILPNAIPPLITLLPFAIMAAITSEAGLSFLGLGEEGSSSWGVLMDEGRSAFPGEAYLLWPPAILLTALLIAIALVGDALRDALDPKLKT